jgi:hypothetical protein
MTELTIEMWRLAVKRGATEFGFEEWKKDCEEKAAALVKDPATELFRVTNPELATILAGLELLLQARLKPEDYPQVVLEGIDRIANDDGEVTPLRNGELINLIEQLNAGDRTPKTAAYLYLRKDGKVATIGIHKPGPRCKLDVKELVMK